MNGTTLHLVVAPATQDLTPDREPIVLTCKAIKIEGSLLIFADASSPNMSETAMLDAVFEKLCPATFARAAAQGKVPER